jgi:RNase adaptor protein for sRNA GlmZ degradation
MRYIEFIVYGTNYFSTFEGLDLYINCKWVKNPYRNKNLRNLTGLDKEVIHEVCNSHGFYKHIEEFCKKIREDNSIQRVGVYCSAGKHRSVVVANVLASRLKDYDVKITYMNSTILKRLKEKV